MIKAMVSEDELCQATKLGLHPHSLELDTGYAFALYDEQNAITGCASLVLVERGSAAELTLVASSSVEQDRQLVFHAIEVLRRFGAKTLRVPIFRGDSYTIRFFQSMMFGLNNVIGANLIFEYFIEGPPTWKRV